MPNEVSKYTQSFVDKLSLAHKIFKTAYITGNFKLRSGQISHEYFDKYLFESDPYLLQAITDHLMDLIPPQTQILAGLEMGGIPLATVLSLKTGLPLAFVRKKAKDYGTCRQVEGTQVKGQNVCVVEDVITTGGQVILSCEDLEKNGTFVSGIVCVLNRNKKVQNNSFLLSGFKCQSLFRLDELKSL